ncbi:MAG: 4Fe-4S cluster-binding domain-containing protein [Bacteroidales bacterium]|nr:4Fe-4S cluster-binding domain-containing protein [Bacteroidales bacterium]
MSLETNMLDIHVFKAHGTFFLYDVQTNYKEKIEPSFYEVLKFLEYPLSADNYAELSALLGPTEADIAIRNIEHYIKKGKINYFKIIESKQKRIPINSLDLCVVQDCNMKCTYCYAHYGTYSENLTTSKMTAETARKAVDFLLEHSKDYPYIKITFFGGEPLLNFEVIKEVVRYADSEARLKKKRVIYDMVTNGTLLKEAVCQFLLEHNISIIVSLDGYKELNDQTKLFGKSHYEAVIKNIKPFTKKLHITTRTTTCKTNYKANNTYCQSF